MQNDEVHRKLQIVGRVVKTYVQNPQKNPGEIRSRTLKNKREMNKTHEEFFGKPVYTNNVYFFSENMTGIMHKKLRAKDDRERGSIEISCLCIDQSRY